METKNIGMLAKGTYVCKFQGQDDEREDLYLEQEDGDVSNRVDRKFRMEARIRFIAQHLRTRPQPIDTMAFKLPPLPYDYAALEPYIDARTMEIHHTKHHATYVNNVNAALEKFPELKGLGLEDLNKKVGTAEIPAEVATVVRNNGGGAASLGPSNAIMACSEHFKRQFGLDPAIATSIVAADLGPSDMHVRKQSA